MAFKRAVTAPTEEQKQASGHQSGTMKGLAGFEQAEQINRQRDLRKFIPRDYKLDQANPHHEDPRYRREQPEEGEVILLDTDEICWRYVHEVGKGKDRQLVICPQEFEMGCPLCQGAKGEAPRVMILTCIDMRAYQKKKDGQPVFDKDGQPVMVEWTRKRMIVKKQSQGLFKDIFIQNGGTFRGAHLHMKRQPGDTSAAIGHPTYLEKATDEEIAENFPDPGYKDPESGRVIRAPGANHRPQDYDLLYPTPTVAQIRAQFGHAPVPGSKSFNTEFGNVNRGRPQPGAEADGEEGHGEPPLDDVDPADIPFD